MGDNYITIKIDLDLLGRRLILSGKRFISIHEISYELGITPQAAGKLLSSLSRLGYVVKWSKGVYMVRKSGL